MKKLLAAGAVLATSLVPASSASADTVCTPITIDGQPIACVDKQPVDDVLALVGGVAGTGEDVAESEAVVVTQCPRVVTGGGEVSVYIAYAGGVEWDQYACTGYKLTFSLGSTMTTVPVHVPEVCVSTTGTCIGPYDTTVTVPTGSSGEVCVEAENWWEPTSSPGSWTDYPSSSLPSPGCEPLSIS